MKAPSKPIIILLTVSLLWATTGVALAGDPELSAVQESIRQKGLNWVAGETSVSRLPPEQRRNLLGALMDDQAKLMAGTAPRKVTATYTYPSSWDWRNVNGQDWTTSIRNQGNCGSCVAFATAGAIESRLEIASHDPNLAPDLSEAHLFFCGNTFPDPCGTGWYPSSAMNFSQNTGIADEPCFPYHDYNMSCSTKCSDWADRVTKIDDWAYTTNTSEMKQALYDNGPIEVTMYVYTDFYYYTGGVYQHTWGGYEGGHAITLVGYDDPNSYWIVKNSWSTGWGENGWFRIAYGDSGIDSEAYIPNVPTVMGTLSGYVKTAGGAGISGVTVNVSGQDAATTNASGYYQKSVPLGTYTVTPTKLDYSFSPSSRQVSVETSAQLVDDFIGSYAPWPGRAYLPVIMRDYNPNFNWIDATDGTVVANADDTYTSVSLPFNFPFYGNSYNRAYVSSNGFVSFGQGYTTYINQNIPATSTPNNAIYGFWDDLQPAGGGGGGYIYAKQVDSNTYVVEWYGVNHWNRSDAETFEIILKSDGTVKLLYQTVSDATSCTVGAENAAGTAATKYLYNGSGSPLGDDTMFEFTP